MHHIYHTTGIIFDARETGEANKFLTILTREEGMVRAAAQGIRHGKSKLRFALQDFSYAKIDLVRGRDVWRVTSAQPISSFLSLSLSRDTAPLFKNIIKLVGRLYDGESPNEALFDHLMETFTALSEKKFTATDLKHFEVVVVLRILYHLGYLAHTKENDALVRSPLDGRLIEEAAKVRAEMLTAINQSLRETQL